jgi:hypothetical protein
VSLALFGGAGRALTQRHGLPTPRGPGRAGDEYAATTLASAERVGNGGAAAIEFYGAALQQPDSGFA